MSASLTRRRLLGSATLAGLSLSAFDAFGQTPGVESDRVESLIARMTPAEKAGQLSCFSDQVRPTETPFNPDLPTANATGQLDMIRRGEVGMLFNGVGVAGARRAQDAAVQDARLKIPLIFAADAIHGLRTIYPLPVAEACAFDPDLAERTARAAALEMTAAQLMTTVLHTVHPSTSVPEAMAHMTQHRVRHLPVLEDDELVGMISIGDVVLARLDQQAQDVESLRAYVAGSV